MKLMESIDRIEEFVNFEKSQVIHEATQDAEENGINFENMMSVVMQVSLYNELLKVIPSLREIAKGIES